MGKFDKTIEWLNTQMENAADALNDIKGGFRIERNGEDVTGWWKAKYEQIIEESKRLIAAYGKRNE
jgi:hypothetical protein